MDTFDQLCIDAGLVEDMADLAPNVSDETCEQLRHVFAFLTGFGTGQGTAEHNSFCAIDYISQILRHNHPEWPESQFSACSKCFLLPPSKDGTAVCSCGHVY